MLRQSGIPLCESIQRACDGRREAASAGSESRKQRICPAEYAEAGHAGTFCKTNRSNQGKYKNFPGSIWLCQDHTIHTG